MFCTVSVSGCSETSPGLALGGEEHLLSEDTQIVAVQLVELPTDSFGSVLRHHVVYCQVSL